MHYLYVHVAIEVNFTNSDCQHTRAVIKDHKLQPLQWLGMLDES